MDLLAMTYEKNHPSLVVSQPVDLSCDSRCTEEVACLGKIVPCPLGDSTVTCPILYFLPSLPLSINQQAFHIKLSAVS